MPSAMAFLQLLLNDPWFAWIRPMSGLAAQIDEALFAKPGETTLPTDLLLEEHSEGWTLSRMAALDRTILRVGVFELLHRPDVPTSVAISEAVEAASQLSSDESKAFVNGILGRIARETDRPEPAPD